MVHFWAPWAPQCAQMNDVMAELAKEHPQVSFVKLEAETVPEVSEKYEISSVPTFLFFKVRLKTVEEIAEYRGAAFAGSFPLSPDAEHQVFACSSP